MLQQSRPDTHKGASVPTGERHMRSADDSHHHIQQPASASWSRTVAWQLVGRLGMDGLHPAPR